MRRYMFAGLALVLLVVFGVGGWALSVELAGAVITEGQLVVQSDKKTIQSPSTGIIADLLVQNGDRVNAGDVVVRLDDSQARANLGIIQRQIDEDEAQQARVETEIAGGDTIAFPQDLTDRAADPTVAHILAGETDLFNARGGSRQAEKDQYQKQIDQLNQQIAGLQAQEAGDQQQIDWNTQVVDKYQQLLKQQLTLYSNVSQAEMDAARLGAELGNLQASVAEANGKIAETQLKVIQVDEDMRSDDGNDLADLRSNLAQLQEKLIAAQDELDRLNIRAPQAGTVQELVYHAPGGAVEAGQTIMALVPDSDALIAEVRVRPQDIDQLYLGQEAAIRFVAFNQRSTPEINGEVSLISADVEQDNRTGAAYYLVRIALPPEEIAKLGDLKLVPGMPVEGFVATPPRTALSYFARPILDQVNRAFKEK